MDTVAQARRKKKYTQALITLTSSSSEEEEIVRFILKCRAIDHHDFYEQAKKVAEIHSRNSGVDFDKLEYAFLEDLPVVKL